MSMFFALRWMQSTDDGLTLKEVLSGLPSDPASIFTLSILALSVGLIAWYGRPGRKRGGGA